MAHQWINEMETNKKRREDTKAREIETDIMRLQQEKLKVND